MYNEWEKNQKSIYSDNDVDMTEGSYVDSTHYERTQENRQADRNREAGQERESQAGSRSQSGTRQMYGRISSQDSGRQSYGSYEYTSQENQRNTENTAHMDSRGNEPERRRRKKGKLAKTAAGVAAAGILFGCVAGGTMAGINYLAVKLGGQPELSTEAGTQENTDINTENRIGGGTEHSFCRQQHYA